MNFRSIICPSSCTEYTVKSEIQIQVYGIPEPKSLTAILYPLLSSPPALLSVDSGLHSHLVPISLAEYVADPASDWISFSACRTRSQRLGVPGSCPPPLPPSHQQCSFRYHPRYLDPALPDLAPSTALERQGNTHRCMASSLPTPPRTSAGLHHSFVDSTARGRSNK